MNKKPTKEDEAAFAVFLTFLPYIFALVLLFFLYTFPPQNCGY